MLSLDKMEHATGEISKMKQHVASRLQLANQHIKDVLISYLLSHGPARWGYPKKTMNSHGYTV